MFDKERKRILIENIMIQLEIKSIHTLDSHGLRGVLRAKLQCRGSLLVIEGSMAQPCLFRNLMRKSISTRVASFRDSAVETCLLDDICLLENCKSLTRLLLRRNRGGLAPFETSKATVIVVALRSNFPLASSIKLFSSL